MKLDIKLHEARKKLVKDWLKRGLKKPQIKAQLGMSTTRFYELLKEL